MLSAKITQLGFFVLYGVCLAVLMKMGLEEQKRWVFYPSFLALFGLSFWSLNVIVCIIDLAIRRRAAIRAEAREPEPNITSIQRVNWWSMLKAGFEPIIYERPFQHPELRWKARRGACCSGEAAAFPSSNRGAQSLETRRENSTRSIKFAWSPMPCYSSQRAIIDVPYGLVFPVDSPHGLAFPITVGIARTLHPFAL